MIMTSFNESSGSSSIGGGGIALGKWRKNFYNNTAEDIADAIDFGVAKDLWSDQVGVEIDVTSGIFYQTGAIDAEWPIENIKYGYYSNGYGTNVGELNLDASLYKNYLCKAYYHLSEINTNKIIAIVHKLELSNNTNTKSILSDCLNAAKTVSKQHSLANDSFILKFFYESTMHGVGITAAILISLLYDENKNVFYKEITGTY